MFLSINSIILLIVQEVIVTSIDKLDTGFSNFKDATKRAGLQGSVTNETVTIFSPDNKAFKTVFDRFNYQKVSLEELRKVILRHVIKGEIKLKQLQSGPVSSFMNCIRQAAYASKLIFLH